MADDFGMDDYEDKILETDKNLTSVLNTEGQAPGVQEPDAKKDEAENPDRAEQYSKLKKDF